MLSFLLYLSPCFFVCFGVFFEIGKVKVGTTNVLWRKNASILTALDGRNATIRLQRLALHRLAWAVWRLHLRQLEIMKRIIHLTTRPRVIIWPKNVKLIRIASKAFNFFF